MALQAPRAVGRNEERAMMISETRSASAPAELTQMDCAQTCDVQISAAMLKAGTAALALGDDEFESADEIVSRIYRSMIAARA